MSEKKKLAAFVIGDSEENLQAIDIVKIQPVSPTVFIIETVPFDNRCIKDDLEKFSKEQLQFYLNSLFPK